MYHTARSGTRKPESKPRTSDKVHRTDRQEEEVNEPADRIHREQGARKRPGLESREEEWSIKSQKSKHCSDFTRCGLGREEVFVDYFGREVGWSMAKERPTDQ